MPILFCVQISPFPYDLVKAECAKYPNAEIVWAQEEHKNQGCWTYIQPRFLTALNGSRDVRYDLCERVSVPTMAEGSCRYNVSFLDIRFALFLSARITCTYIYFFSIVESLPLQTNFVRFVDEYTR